MPVHASGPYLVPNVAHHGRACYTNAPPAGAFRGFGVPQAAIAQEALMDELADKLGIDRLEFRIRNALRVGDADGDRPDARPSPPASARASKRCGRIGARRRTQIAAFNAAGGPKRRGVGVGGMWYGIGNTSLSNPSTMRVGLRRPAR